VTGGDPRTTYDGGFEVSGESTDETLARLWPEYAALAAEPDHARVAQALYGPLASWLKDHLSVQPIEGEGA